MSTLRPVKPSSCRFPETDGVPLESSWHRDEINLLVDLCSHWFRERDDFYVAGNMFIYWDPSSWQKSAGPDFFYVKGVPREPERRIWAVWEEGGRFPDTIIELMSPSTKHKDRKTNKVLYAGTFHTPEYFLYDPSTRKLDGWRLIENAYEPLVPDERGWLWSQEMNLWLGTWEGKNARGVQALWLRFYDSQGQLVPTPEETRQQEAEAERKRAEAAEAEVARLKALLGQTPPSSNGPR